MTFQRLTAIFFAAASFIFLGCTVLITPELEEAAREAIHQWLETRNE